MVEFTSNTVVENLLGSDKFFPDIFEFFSVPDFVVKEILVINDFKQFGN